MQASGTVTIERATKLVFTSSPVVVAAGSSSSIITVERQDASSAPAIAGNLTVHLSSTSGGGSFRDAGDTAAIVSIVIPDGSSSASFRYQDTTAGSPTITAADQASGPDVGLTDATQQETVDPAALASIVISPSSASIAAGTTQAYTAEGFDAFSNSRGDVTGDTTFSIDGTGTCLVADCGSNDSGSYTVTGTDGLFTDTATLVVTPAAAASITIDLSPSTIIADGVATTTVSGDVTDTFGNPRSGDTVTITSSGDVLGTTTLTDISGHYSTSLTSSTTADTETITATDGLATDSAVLTEIAGPLASISISPVSSSIVAGTTQAYTAEGFDAFSNSRGDVTGDTTFSIDGTGTCLVADCGSNDSGSYTVTGTDGLFTDTATLVVDPAALASIVISPSSASIAAGTTQAYTAEGFDAFSNSRGDVTGDTTFSIDGTGTCLVADCGSNDSGSYTVTGTDGLFTDTATLVVDPAALASIVISPSSASIAAGTTQAYTAEGFDAFSNSRGDVTGDTTFSIDGTGTCLVADCGSNDSGSCTVTGTDGLFTDTATLVVDPAALASIVISPSSASIAAGTTQAYTAEGFDAFSNSRGDVTGDTTFSIDGTGTCLVADCGSNDSGSYTVTGTDGLFTDTATLVVGTLSQTITFGPLADRTYGDAPFLVTATASSGQAVTFSSTTGAVCSVSGSTVTILATGLCTIQADQTGNATYDPAPPVQQSFTVDPAVTTTVVTSDNNPSTFGQSVTFTATVTYSTGNATGMVQWSIDSVDVGSPVALVAGEATLTTASLSVGSHTVAADYLGTPSLGISSDSLSQVVNQAVSSTLINSSLTTHTVTGESYTVDVTVSSTGGTPTGTVLVSEGTNSCLITLVAGNGSCLLTSMSVGVKTITATYGGDGNFSGSGDSKSHTVDQAATTTAVASNHNPSANGQNVTFTATVTADAPGSGTPAGTVQFTIDSSPFGGPVALVGGQASGLHQQPLGRRPHGHGRLQRKRQLPRQRLQHLQPDGQRRRCHPLPCPVLHQSDDRRREPHLRGRCARRQQRGC